MSERKITTIEITCDVCGAEKISPVSAIHKEVFGHRQTHAFGVEIRAVPFGDYCTHVCALCAVRALAAAAEARLGPNADISGR